MGRKTDVVGLDPETFDHGQTDFVLREAHAIAHEIKEAIRGLPGVADAVIHVDVHGE